VLFSPLPLSSPSCMLNSETEAGGVNRAAVLPLPLPLPLPEPEPEPAREGPAVGSGKGANMGIVALRTLSLYTDRVSCPGSESVARLPS
jgi:hypothetical protein